MDFSASAVSGMTRRSLLGSIALTAVAQSIVGADGWAMSPTGAPEDDAAIDVRAYGAIFDGRDNTVAIQRAIAVAASSPTSRTVRFPPGDSLLSGTLNVPSGVRTVGAGSVNTRFRRIGDYGDTFVFGDPDTGYVSGGAAGFMIYQDHGLGFFPPNTENAFRNRATRGAHLRVHPDSHCRWTDLLLIGLTNQIRRRGGLASTHDQVDCYGIFDPAVPALQETTAAILIEGDLKAIPTDVEFISCRISGMTSPIRTIAWPGGKRTADAVQNAGARYGLDIECCEGVRWTGGYIGAAAESGVRLKAKSGSILSAFSLDAAFVDSCGYTGLLIDPRGGGTATQVTWQPSEHNSQGNGFCAVTDMVVAPSTGFSTAPATVPSVVGLSIAGQYRAQLGSAVVLSDARAVRIDANARAWNVRGFYTAQSSFDAFAVLGPRCRAVAITGLYGGGMNGDGGGQDAVMVRYPKNAAPAARIVVEGRTGADTVSEGGLL